MDTRWYRTDLMRLELAPHLTETFRWIVNKLDEVIPRSSYMMGGGSVLEARWHHRHSTDIDLFTSSNKDGFDIDAVIEVCQREEAEGTIDELFVTANGFTCEHQGTPVSLFDLPSTLRGTYTEPADTLLDTDVTAESNVSILSKKIQGRMVNQPVLKGRDAYDLVVAHVEDAWSIRQVFATELSDIALNLMLFDSMNTAIQIDDDQRVLEPRYPNLMCDKDTLLKFTRLAMSRALFDPKYLNELQFMRRDTLDRDTTSLEH